MKVKYAKTFAKQYDKADVKIQKAFKERIILFQKNPLHPRLRNHPLKGKYKGYKSINITGDWRALYTEMRDDSDIVVLFKIIGTHSQLYR